MHPAETGCAGQGGGGAAAEPAAVHGAACKMWQHQTHTPYFLESAVSLLCLAQPVVRQLIHPTHALAHI